MYIKSTQKEELSNNEYIGHLSGNDKYTPHLSDIAKRTQKEKISDNDYQGNARGSLKYTTQLQDEVKCTQKAGLSNNPYQGNAKGSSKDSSRLADENADTNSQKEIISLGRSNNKQGPKRQLDSENYNIRVNKQEYNNFDNYSQNYQRTIQQNNNEIRDVLNTTLLFFSFWENRKNAVSIP